MSFLNSISPSFLERLVANPKISESNIDFSSITTTADVDSLTIDPNAVIDTGINNYANYTGWSFITAPEDVSWDIANQANRVDIFGTNNPPVVAGSRGMRDLTLGNALVEGFVRNVTIEGKITSLEKLMNYSLNTSDGYVSVPVYQVWANEKSYGGSNAYYIIKDIKVKETMRDLKGNATRAFVDISLMQVPAYQVQSGRDQASQVTAGGVAIQQRQGVAGQGNQNMQGKGGTPATNGNSKPGAGPNAGGKASTSGFQGPGGLREFDLRTGQPTKP
jgi:hypothetical protein